MPCVCEVGGVDRALARAGAVAWLDEHGVAARLRELKEDATTWLGRTFTGQFSLAGAQAKTALLRSGERWGVPSGSTPTTHILKLAVAASTTTTSASTCAWKPPAEPA